MRKTFTQMRRTGIALLLVLCMVVGMVPAAVFAAEAKDRDHDGVINYVSLGDSMTNGYGMPGYDHNGYLHNVPNTYPELLAQAFHWNHIPLAVSGMRAEDLQFVLEFPWQDPAAVAVAERTPLMDGYTAAKYGRNYAELWWTQVNAEKWYDTFRSGDFYTWDQSIIQSRFNDSYYDIMAQNGKGYGAGVENIARMIQESVADAEVISLAVGNANFGVFMRSRLVNAMAMMDGNSGGNMWLDVDRVLGQCDPQVGSLLGQLYEVLLDQGGSFGLEEETAEALADATIYTVASYLSSYDAVIELIMESNPNADVIIVGLMNTLKGMEIKYDGMLVDLGQYMGIVIDVVNAYLAKVPSDIQASGAYKEARFFFASASEVNMWVEEYSSVASNWEKYPVIRDRFITKVCDTLFPMVQNGSWKPRTITRRDVEAFETAQKAGNAAFMKYAQENSDKAASVATYKAFENAIVQTYSMDAPDVTVLMNMENGLDAVVTQAMNVYTEKTDAKIKEIWASVVAEVVPPMMDENDATLKDALNYVERNAQLKASLLDVCKLLATPETLTEALIADETIGDLLSLLARLEIGDGIGCHPSTEGHAILAKAVIDAYRNDRFAADAVQDNLMEALMSVLQIAFEDGDEIFEFAEKNGFLDEGTKAVYLLQEDSRIVGLGDGTATSKSYVDLLAQELEIGCTNLASEAQTVETVGDVIKANQAAIAKADMVTLGFGSNGFTTFAMGQMMKVLSGGSPELNWTKYLSEEDAATVKEAMGSLKETVADSVGGGNLMGFDLAELMSVVVESYAYAFVAYAYCLPEAVEAIHALNPDALVIVVGMHNPVAEVELELGGEKLAIGEYLQYLVDAANMSALAMAMTTDKMIFISAPDVESKTNAKNMSILQFAMEFVNKNAASLVPSQAGHTYIKERILRALTVREGLLGDADGNGVVNTVDALLVLRYYTGAVTADKLSLAVCDVDGNGVVNTVDSLMILRYYTGEITTFPAAR